MAVMRGTATTSKTPSSNDASGATRAPCPYCWPLHTTTRSASISIGTASSSLMRKRCGATVRHSCRIDVTYGIRPRRRLLVLNRSATAASKPIPARFRNGRPLTRPVSMSRGCPSIATWTAARRCSGRPSPRARPFPDPPGTTPSRIPVSSRFAATSLSVPSPPHTTTRSEPASSAVCTAWAASPRPVVSVARMVVAPNVRNR